MDVSAGARWAAAHFSPTGRAAACSLYTASVAAVTSSPTGASAASFARILVRVSVPSPIPSASRYKRARVNERRAVAKGSMGDVARLRADERGKGSPAARARVGCRRDWWEADLQVPPAHFEVGQARTRAAA